MLFCVHTCVQLSHIVVCTQSNIWLGVCSVHTQCILCAPVGYEALWVFSVKTLITLQTGLVYTL